MLAGLFFELENPGAKQKFRPWSAFINKADVPSGQAVEMSRFGRIQFCGATETAPRPNGGDRIRLFCCDAIPIPDDSSFTGQGFDLNRWCMLVVVRQKACVTVKAVSFLRRGFL